MIILAVVLVILIIEAITSPDPTVLLTYGGYWCCVLCIKFYVLRPNQVMAYSMKEYGMSLEEASAHVKERRSCVNPNNGFLKQLKAYEGILKAR